MPCEITLYHCPEDRAAIARLSNNANAQQARDSGFSENVKPWKGVCKNEYHYIARDTKTGIICGWLSIILKTFKRTKYVYIVEISTRRIRNDLYGGVGQRLHNKMVEDAIQFGAKFVYLFPLNGVVRELYMRPQWGYTELRSDVKHLFKPLVRDFDIPNEFLDTLAEPDIIEAAIAIAKRDKALLRLIKELTPIIRANPEYLRRLEEEIDIMEVNELSDSDKRGELRSFLSNILKN
jgi:hypothetical protein